jgi:ABC-type nitrate/sulfonate/bicarbonate transport system permease component
VSGIKLEGEASPRPRESPGQPATRLRPTLSRARKIWAQSYSILVILGAWELVTRTGIVDTLFLPHFSSVLQHLYTGVFVDQELLIQTGDSMTRVCVGLFFGLVAGVVIGALMAQFTSIDNFLERPLSFLFPTPKLALFPLFMLWLGLGESSKIAVIAVTVFFPMMVNTYAGIKSVDKFLIWNARTKGANRFHVMTRVSLPSAVPFIVTGFRVCASFAFLVTIAVEMLVSNNGLGYEIVVSQRTFEPEQMFAAILIVAILGFTIDRLAGLASRHVLRWQEKE